MADWNKIKKEYISGNCTYRSLAEKHKVSFSRLSKLAVKEKWPELRAQAWEKSEKKLIENVAAGKSKIENSLIGATATLVGKAAEGIASAEAADYRALKAYSGILRDAKEILDIRPQGDLDEQKARIARLRAEVDKVAEGANTSISVSLGGVESWAE